MMHDDPTSLTHSEGFGTVTGMRSEPKEPVVEAVDDRGTNEPGLKRA